MFRAVVIRSNGPQDADCPGYCQPAHEEGSLRIDNAGGAAMTDPNPWRYAPTRSELKIWLVISCLGFCLMAVALTMHGIPKGPAIFEVAALPGLFLGYLFARSVKRLIRREHP
jgi:hypothetical protein